MTKLSDTQAAILAAAAAADDTTAPADAKSAVAGLVKRGFILSTPQAEGPNLLTITEAGRAAIAIDASPEPSPQSEETAAPPAAASTRRRARKGALDAPAPKVEPEPAVPTLPTGKVGALIGLLRQEGGTTVDAMMAATGWQAHSVRGAMSGAIKKNLGLEVLSEKTETGRVYRIPSGAAA